MLDFGWPELLIILVITIFVVGPEDIPKVMVGIGRIFRRFQYIKFALSKQFEDIMHEADLDDIRKSVNFEDKDLNTEDFNEAEADEEYLAEILQSEELKEGGDDDKSTS
ncbi:MAG: twin-arginine translocase TatA/TatE family subunit [Alphaproteobacteria bacterium]|nr:twin-arginine translocase TatA/TatE family subunit [Alphaproteobacteria bacterium]